MQAYLDADGQEDHESIFREDRGLRLCTVVLEINSSFEQGICNWSRQPWQSQSCLYKQQWERHPSVYS